MSRHWLINAHGGRLPLAANSIDCCVTSPPYFGLRQYNDTLSRHELGVGLNLTDYIERVVACLRQVRRALKPTGTLWLNIGDRFATPRIARLNQMHPGERMGIPWTVALALREDGWRLRMDVVWNKPNGTPESVKDRPTAVHEYLFMLYKFDHYYYNEEAVREPSVSRHSSGNGFKREARLTYKDDNGARGNDREWVPTDLRRCRSVWNISTKSYRKKGDGKDHFATFPPELAHKCVAAGTPPGGVVLDPFAGYCTVAVAANALGRDSISVDLYRKYLTRGRERLLLLPP